MPTLARVATILAAWALLTGAVYAAAAAAGVREVRLRRCVPLALPSMVLAAAWFIPATKGSWNEIVITAAAGLVVLLIVGMRYLLRTTWPRALATLAVTCLYAFTLFAIVWRLGGAA